MKFNFVFLLFLFFLSAVSAQEQQLYSSQKVHSMPIFSGCEKHDPTDRKLMNNCISSQLSLKLFKSLNGFDEVMRQSGFETAETLIQFVVSKEGVIIDIRALEGGNPILGDAFVMAFEQIAMELPPIQPAKLKDGEAVNIVFQLPFEYRVAKTRESKPNSTFPVEEIVLFTLNSENKSPRYEVRLYKNKDIKVYEVNDQKDIFLGKYLTLYELEKSEPFKTLIENERKSNRTLVTEGTIDNEFYQIVIHNLFQSPSKKSVFVEVLKEVNGKFKSVEKFEKEEEFNQSPYAPLIYRNKG